MDTSKDPRPWPLTSKPLAFAPGMPETTAVPVKHSDRELSQDLYLQRLELRLAWLAEHDPNPKRTAELILMEMGYDLELPSQPADIAAQLIPFMLDMGMIPVLTFPLKVKYSEAAKEAIETVTFADFLNLLKPTE